MCPDCRKKELESETNKFSLDTLRRRLYAVSDATGKLPESVTITRKEFMSAFRKGDTASKGFTILVGNGMDEGQTRIAGAVTDD